jgi:pimeloyl-ACP methyl ester carboxylesterase
MPSFRPAALCALALLLGLSWSGVARAAGHVYLLRGIFNVSVGLDVLAGKLARQGVAATVYGHDEASTVATLAAQQFHSGTARPIVLIGHSLGAGAAVAVARQLDGAGIPVALLVLLDPVAQEAVPSNVGRAVNLYVSGGQGTTVNAASGFHGSLNNLDFRNAGMDHMSIQAADSVHLQIIGYVRAAASGQVRVALRPVPSPKMPSADTGPPSRRPAAASKTQQRTTASQTAKSAAPPKTLSRAAAHPAAKSAAEQRGGRAKPRHG